MIKITHEDVDIGRTITDAKTKNTGAIVTFLGVVRDDDIERIELETYKEVAEKELEEIQNDAIRSFGLLSVDIVHRIGSLQIGDNILLIVVSAGHRREAFLGCEYILERIKRSVPIWKKEILAEGDRWVEGTYTRNIHEIR